MEGENWEELVAIQFARLEYVSRSSGGNSCRKSAYNGRQRIHCEREGQTFDFRREGDNVHHEILLPKGVAEKFSDAETLWNAVEHKEQRKNSQLAKELVLALPDDPQVSLEDKVALTKSFLEKHFVQKGLAAQIDIHKPHKEKDHNWHAHILITTRRFSENGQALGEKARDLDASVRKGKVIEGEKWGKLWADHQNTYFAEKGIDLKVDPTAIVPQEHLGPVRMRARAFAMLNEKAQIAETNAALSVKPDEILKKLTEKQSFFTKEDVEQFIKKHVPTEAISETRKAFWTQSKLLQLLDPKSEARLDQYTSTEVREEENRILRLSERIHHRSGLKVSDRSIRETLESSKLNQEQQEAFQRIIGGPRLACVEGRAGTGKSYLIGALKDVYQASGYQVRGLAPTSEVAQDLLKKGFTKAENIHRFLFRQKHGHESVGNQEVWVIDEAAMVGNGSLTELLKLSWKKNCQVILVGDARQLPSVERGGMFEIFCQKYHSHELGTIKRQERQEDREIATLTAKGEIGLSID